MNEKDFGTTWAIDSYIFVQKIRFKIEEIIVLEEFVCGLDSKEVTLVSII